MSHPSPTQFFTTPPYIPFMLGSIFLLMAFDHALHAYSETYGVLWFFKDYKRTMVFDYFYLVDQTIIMPVLFFCMGNIFVYQIMTRPAKHVLYKIIITYIVPFIIGVLFIVPLLVYPRYSEYQDPNISLSEFYRTLYFDKFLQAGPFWVMYALTVYSLFTWAIISWSPRLTTTLSKFFIKRYFNLIIVTFVVLLVSDLMWGAPWWIGFAKLFYLQGARFISNFIFFLMGALWCLNYNDRGIRTTLENQSPSINIFLWVVAITMSAGYGYYCINTSPYPHFINRLIYQKVEFAEAVRQVLTTIKYVIIRIALMTMTLCSLFWLYLKLSYSNKWASGIWYTLSLYCYGIFIFHESITVWLQFYFIDLDYSPLLKALIVFILSFSGAWIMTACLMTIKPLRKMLFLVR